jgi:small subunit ribosomal protein S16
LLRIRLRRVGKKKRPAYRVVVADSRAPRDGAFIETLGLYDPLTDPATLDINEEKARKWLQQGAKPSETVAKLMIRQGLLPKKADESPPQAE